MGELDSERRGDFEDAIRRRSPAALERLRDKWPELLQAARECAQSRAELEDDIVQLLSGDECWELRVKAWVCLCRPAELWERRRNLGKPPVWDVRVAVALREDIRESPDAWSQSIAVKALRKCWDKFDPTRRSLNAYLSTWIDIEVDRYLRSEWRNTEIGRKQCKAKDAPRVTSLDAPKESEGYDAKGRDLPHPDGDPLALIIAEDEAGRIAARWAELCLGPPTEWRWQAPPPHKGLPLWWRGLDLEARDLQGFADSCGRVRLVVLAKRWVGEYAHYWWHQHAWWRDAKERVTDHLPRGVFGALRLFEERLKLRVREHVAPQGGGHRGLEAILDTPAGHTWLEQYARGADLVNQIYHWLDDALQHVRRQVRRLEMRQDFEED